MSNMMRFILMLTTLFCLSVQGAYAISVSVSAGNVGSSASATTIFLGTEIDKVQQEMKIEPQNSGITNHLYFTGSGSTSRTAGTYYGPRATTGFSVDGLPGATKTWYEFSTYSSPSYSRSWMDLTSLDAHSIKAYGLAQSSRYSPKNYVYGDVYIYSPGYTADLTGYTVSAAAYTTEASLSQDYSSAYTSGSGGYIRPYVYASDNYDWSKCEAYLRSSYYYSAFSPFTSGAGLGGGYKGYAHAHYTQDHTTTWQDAYARTYSWSQYSKAYQSYRSKTFEDIDIYYPTGRYHLLQQDSGTGTTSGYAYDTHYW